MKHKRNGITEAQIIVKPYHKDLADKLYGIWKLFNAETCGDLKIDKHTRNGKYGNFCSLVDRAVMICELLEDLYEEVCEELNDNIETFRPVTDDGKALLEKLSKKLDKTQ